MRMREKEKKEREKKKEERRRERRKIHKGEHRIILWVCSVQCTRCVKLVSARCSLGRRTVFIPPCCTLGRYLYLLAVP